MCFFSRLRMVYDIFSMLMPNRLRSSIFVVRSCSSEDILGNSL